MIGKQVDEAEEQLIRELENNDLSSSAKRALQEIKVSFITDFRGQRVIGSSQIRQYSSVFFSPNSVQNRKFPK